MTNQPTSNPPPGGKKTPKSKSVFNKFKSFAKKVSRPSTKDDYSVVNAIAAVQVENSRILNRAGRFVPDGPIIAAPGETLGHSDSQGCSKDFSAMPGVQLPKNLTSRDAPDQSDNLLLVTTASEEMEDINRSLTTVSTSFNYTTQQTLPPARQMTFSQNVPKPVFRVALPEAGDSSISTLQLAFGLHLLSKNPLPSASISELLVTSGKNMQKLVLVLDKDEEAWKSNVEKNSAEQVHVHWLTTRVAIEFLNCPYKDVESIVEVVLLGSALEPKIYQKVVSSLIGQLGSEGLLVPDLLQGLMQLIQEASPGSLTDSELVRILRVLREQLTKTYKELGTAEHAASKHIYQLSTIICRVLDAMMVGNIRALNRTEDYKALLDLLLELKGSPDSYLKFQASYAWQALQYAGDDEPPLHTILRIGGGVTMAALSVASIFKFDPENLFKGLDTLAQAAGQAFDVVKAGVEGAQALRKGGEGVIDSLLKGFRSGFKRAWYPALLAARMCVRDGRVADFEQIIYEAPCRREPEFQWGVCQLLGEIAMDPIWAIEIRQQAVDLLGKLYWSDEEWITDAGAKQAILGILRYISINAEQIIQDHTRTLLQDLTTNSTGNLPREYPLTILHMMIQSREKYGQPIYILPQAKANLSAADEESFSLMDRVKEFLNSNQQVFLLLGDSGAGKSKFNKHLEHVLCAAYKPGYQIPLFINLPDLENPEKELIMEGLKKGDFSNAEILQLKRDQQFILICDGYDEAQLSNNLHYSNKFNCSGQWNVKMIISCRSTYLEQDYRDRFQPRPIDIEDYVEQFVQEKEVHELDGRSVWSAREYLERLAIIPNLMQLVKNPFLLNMTLKILPVVAKGTSDISKIKMTRLYVYHSFIDEFVELGKRRLLPMPLEAGARDILLELIDEGFSHAVIKFLKNLAAAIFQEQDGNPFVQYNPGCDAGSWKARFFGRSKKLAYLRESSPLTRAGAQHSFIHTSLLEYFYSRHVFDAEASLDIARHPLSQRNLVKEPSIIQFLAEYVQGELGFKQRLLQIIERSKTDVTASQAAANAITILVRAGVLFNGADLKGAQIPGADLSGGQFDSAQLQGSDLSRTNMRRCGIW
ncbi:hypothetical protein BGX24_011881 [Mortierella sp. AD032]|nr:hypothetical protein BGX24_011881 [Mortierella sp. AD032]